MTAIAANTPTSAGPIPFDGAADLPLIQAALAGSRQALADLIRRHEPMVRGYVWQAVHGSHEADDLAQEVFITAWERLADYRGDGPLGAWLLGIARRKVLTLLRDQARRKRRDEQILESLLAEWQAKQVAAAELNETRERERLTRLETCLRGLPPHSRAIIDRFYIHEHSAEEIGRATGKQAGAVRMLLLRIREVLKRCLLRREREDQP